MPWDVFWHTLGTLNIAALESSRREFESLRLTLDERTLRRLAAEKAKELGPGNISKIAKITKLSRTTIYSGLAELKRAPADEIESYPGVRRAGGGRKRLTATDPELLPALESLIEPRTEKASAPLLRWTCKDTQRLSEDLKEQGHKAGSRSVGKLLLERRYRLHRGQSHVDREKQFNYLDQQLRRCQQQGLPVIAIETDVRIDQCTAQFVADSLLRWWQKRGYRRFRGARKLLIVADFNSSHAGGWKLALQRLADDTRLQLTICKLPPDTIRWTAIAKQLVGTWAPNGRRGSPRDHRAEVSLVGSKGRAPATATLDSSRLSDRKVSRAAVAGVKQSRHKFHGDWNFTISPQ